MKKEKRRQTIDKIMSERKDDEEDSPFKRFEREIKENPPKNQADLRRFFRKHALALHPDKAGNEAEFIAMKDAVKVYAQNHPNLTVPATLQGGKRRYKRTRRRYKKTHRRRRRRTRRTRHKKKRKTGGKRRRNQ